MSKVMEPWEAVVRSQFHEQCANCGSGDHLRVKMVVPEAAGGKLIPSNGTLLCRVCWMASEQPLEEGQTGRKPINFWVSQDLYRRLQEPIGFSSMGAAVRYLMGLYVSDPDQFDDLGQYQDEGTDTKVSVWADAETYGRFKAVIGERGLSITEACKSLLMLYLQTHVGN